MTNLAEPITARAAKLASDSHLPAKPRASTCSIDCNDCFLLYEQSLDPNASTRTFEATLDGYLRKLLESHRTPEVVVAWQGGDPASMQLEPFRVAVELVEKHLGPQRKVQHTLQTNGTLLDDEWCSFLKEHGFVIGLSVNGPQQLHEAYWGDRHKRGTFEQVVAVWQNLRRYGIEFEVLCTVNAANENFGREVYRFIRDKLRARRVQFVPAVEQLTVHSPALANRANLGWSIQPGRPRSLDGLLGDKVAEHAVGGAQYGHFLVDVFEEWVRHDVGRVYVQLFDVTLEAYWNGSWPKDHFATSRDGNVKQNYLYPGLELFLTHARPAMQAMAVLLQQGHAPSAVMKLIAAQDAKREVYLPCPCGNGKKFRSCHGNRRPRWAFSHVLHLSKVSLTTARSSQETPTHPGLVACATPKDSQKMMEQ